MLAAEESDVYVDVDSERLAKANLVSRTSRPIYKEKQGKYEEAEEMFNKCIEVEKDAKPHPRLELGKLYSELGRKKEAEEQFKKAVEIDGDNIKLTNKGLDLANIVWEEFV